MTRSTPFRPLSMDASRWQGLRVGILGGSFNPPHKGHIHISLVAKKMLQLNCIWWLVTPQNPLKKHTAEARPYEDRFAACIEITRHTPHLIVSDFEKRLGLNYSVDTVSALNHYYPNTKFAFLMGMDNALGFHKWEGWRSILDQMATAQIARPPYLTMVESCPFKQIARQRHIFLDRSHHADLKPRTSYWIMQNRMVNLSSTKIRSKSNT